MLHLFTWFNPFTPTVAYRTGMLTRPGESEAETEAEAEAEAARHVA